MINICSVTIKQKQHGLHFYSSHLEDLISSHNHNIRFFRSYYLDQGTSFRLSNSRGIDYDLIHIQYDTESLFYNATVLDAVVKTFRLFMFIRRLNKPFVVTMHGLFDSAKYSQLSSILNRIFYLILFSQQKIAIVVHSKNHAEYLKRLFPSYQHGINYVPHLIYKDLLKDQDKQNNIQKEEKVLTTLGFIGDWKGQKEIIEILSEVYKSKQNFTCYIVGRAVEKKYYKECSDLIRKYSLKGRVVIKNQFLSSRQFAAYLSRANVYLDYHTRQNHASSGTLTHVIATGKIVLCRKLPFILGNNDCSNVIIANNKQEYIKKLLIVLDGESSRKKISYSSIDKLNTVVANAHERLYSSLLTL